MVRLIREEVPVKPSTRLTRLKESPSGMAASRRTEPERLAKELRGELDWIVLKALEKDRTRRYAAASDFARDVERYLHDEPVEACPPSAAYRLSKFVRRNKGPVLAAAGLVLLLVAGVVGTTWGLVRADRARTAEAQQRQLAQENERLAQQNEQKAVAAAATAEAREAETRAVLDFVENKVLAAARPEGQDGGLGRDVMLRSAVEAALPTVEQSFRRQPLIEARLRLTLGKTFLYLGDAGSAATEFAKARSICTERLGPDHRETLACANDLADSYAALGRHAEALKLREETLALRREKLGPDDPDTLTSMNSVARGFSETGRAPEAVELFEKTLALRKAKLGADHPDTLASMHGLSQVYTGLGRLQDVVRLSEETVAMRKARLGPDHPDTLASMSTLAVNYWALGRNAEALKLREEVLDLCKKKLGPDHPDTLTSMANLATGYGQVGRPADALKLNEEALALRKKKLGPDHPATLASMANVASSYAALGRLADAAELGEETLALERAKLGVDHQQTLVCMANLANAYSALGRHADAVKLLEEALALQKAKLGANHPLTRLTTYNIACCHALFVPKAADRAKQADLAMEWLRQAVAAGYRDSAQIGRDTDLDPLRDREDFKKLLAGLEAGKGKK
jgi:tetratricopeptide (TPR) repeat protein